MDFIQVCGMLKEEHGRQVGSGLLRPRVSCMLTNGLWLDEGVHTLASRLQHHSTSTSSDVLGTLGQGTEQY